MKVLRGIGLEERLRGFAFAPRSHLNRVWDTGEVTQRAADAREPLRRAVPLHAPRRPARRARVGGAGRSIVELGKKLVGLEPARERRDARLRRRHARQGRRGDRRRRRPLDRARAPARPRRPAVQGPHRLSRRLPRGAGRTATSGRPAPSGGAPTATSSSTTRPPRASEVYFVTSVPEPVEWLTRESWSAKGDVRELRAAYAGFHADVRAVLDACPDCHKWAILERDPLPRWSDGRVVLLGDACHPMTPYMAQGAATSIEDAAVLARCLAESSGDGHRRRVQALRGAPQAAHVAHPGDLERQHLAAAAPRATRRGSTATTPGTSRCPRPRRTSRAAERPQRRRQVERHCALLDLRAGRYCVRWQIRSPRFRRATCFTFLGTAASRKLAAVRHRRHHESARVPQEETSGNG